jgi:hypothetical protein
MSTKSARPKRILGMLSSCRPRTSTTSKKKYPSTLHRLATPHPLLSDILDLPWSNPPVDITVAPCAPADLRAAVLDLFDLAAATKAFS